MPLPAWPLSPHLPVSCKKKRVLLIGTSAHKRDLRAEVMRRVGIDVDCAADIGEARSWWKADLYDLVLINMEKGSGHRDSFCEDLRGALPPQRLAFLVGGPEYLADLPPDDEQLPVQNADDPILIEVKAAPSTDLKDPTQRWGILEASRRISTVRSDYTARTRAMQDRPAVPRDSEGRVSKRTPESASLRDLRREEME